MRCVVCPKVETRTCRSSTQKKINVYSSLHGPYTPLPEVDRVPIPLNGKYSNGVLTRRIVHIHVRPYTRWTFQSILPHVQTVVRFSQCTPLELGVGFGINTPPHHLASMVHIPSHSFESARTFEYTADRCADVFVAYAAVVHHLQQLLVNFILIFRSTRAP